MYQRHFALARLPFEPPAHTGELFESNARREAEARLNHLVELRGIGLLTERAHEVSGTSKARSARARPPCVATSPPPCIRACIA